MEEELKSCPFCGANADIEETEPHTHGPIASFMPDHHGSFYIECGCGAGLIDEDKERLIKRWNTRACLQPIETAPDDGTPILVIDVVKIFHHVKWCAEQWGGCWQSLNDNTAFLSPSIMTHWTPIPQQPEA